ncbi:MAG: peptidoglycan DD-metalloendopeptidase family protein [Xanthomonadales bacterium]
MTSAPRSKRVRRALFSRNGWIATAFVVCAVSMFLLGRGTAPIPADTLDELQALRFEIQSQQGAVDRLRRNNQLSVNALAVRLAELQAASTRLDALGERLAQMGQLSLEEFDFTQPAPVGGLGPDELDVLGPAGEQELYDSLEALSTRLRRQSSQLDALQTLMVNRQLESDLTPSGWPVRKGWISSRFGERNDPFTGERTQHHGLDFAGTRGTEVLSVASGVVTWAAKRSAYGKTVEIDHGNGYQTRYAHNGELRVKPGEHVDAGQVIALMGDTGRASAPHVHFEVLKDGRRVNPSRFVR